jgi:hypothetical protein
LLVPAFRIAGLVDSTAVDVDSAVTGFVRVEHAPPIRTVEVQLARVEQIQRRRCEPRRSR